MVRCMQIIIKLICCFARCLLALVFESIVDQIRVRTWPPLKYQKSTSILHFYIFSLQALRKLNSRLLLQMDVGSLNQVRALI